VQCIAGTENLLAQGHSAECAALALSVHSAPVLRAYRWAGQ